MSCNYSVLLLEDEPLILMDLEFAGEDLGYKIYAATSCEEAMKALQANSRVDVAILDVSLGAGTTCVPVAQELKMRGIPFILHSGDLNRHEERVRNLNAPLISKPSAPDKVIAAAIAICNTKRSCDIKTAPN